MKEELLDVIKYLKSKKVDYADARFIRARTETIVVKDGKVEALSRLNDAGFGIRVLMGGGWGFASSSKLSAAEMKKTANQALEIARASATVSKEKVRLAPVESYRDKFVTAVRKDPFLVSLDDKIHLLVSCCDVLKKHPKIVVAEATMNFYDTEKTFASTEGSLIEQKIVESGAGYTATAAEEGNLQRRSYPNSHGGDFATRGWEFIEEMDLLGNAERVRNEAVALLSAPNCPAGKKDVIITGSQMALQVHESCGHPIELDRVLGTEISLAGGSFMTLDKFRKLRYGSGRVNIVADATTPGGLGTFGYDDEGVKAQRADIIREGLFVGYLTSRETAPIIGSTSNGTMRADGWNRIPLIRMTNINLLPGDWALADLIADTKEGLLIDTNKSWSIDDRRLNFQFGCEAAWEIKDGKVGQLYRNPMYTGITPEFWNSCDAVTNEKHWHVWGVPNCGKGEPIQTAHVAHGASPARFRGVTVGATR
ncbi:MAG TPA: TldD/PmbA family protein [candidate division Zixibacteria bacterium]|nr:TldD/PmbA family protein [candidate division Zixibacteria bacterium]